jgi:tRNA 2-selenouridine synthase
MKFVPNRLRDVYQHGFDAVLDVRSPGEFEEDHIPGSINLPVLDNNERARVGTIYKQQSPFAARKIGAALVFRNASRHIETQLAHHGRDWRPLVYCWRGGQRSGTLTWMLREIGWRAQVIDGGYRRYRRMVSDVLYDQPLRLRVIQLGGYTGTAKTELLPMLAARGVQVIDLEGMARHRGSLLGAWACAQPSQKGFETALAQAILGLDPERPVVVEAESSKIGRLNLPPSLWDAMKTAPWIEIEAPLEARARYLNQAYDDILSDAEQLREKLHPLRLHRGHALVDRWNDLIAQGDRVSLCQSLAEDHYDLAYDKSARAHPRKLLARIGVNDLTVTDLNRLADQLAKAVHARA